MIGTITFYPNKIWSAGFDAAAEPSVTTQGYTCSGGESTGPAYDLLDAKRASVITIDTASETTDFTIDYDLTANIADADFTIIDNHNLATADAKIRFRYYDSSWITATMPNAYSGLLGSELTSESISSNVIAKPTDGVLLAIITPDDFLNEFAWSFDGATEFNVDITMGEILIGISFTPAVSPEEPTIISNYDGITVNRTWGGQNIAVKRYGERKAWRLTWPVVDEDDKDEFIRVWNDCNGPMYPFYIDLGEATNPQLYNVRFIDHSLQIQRLSANAYKVSVSVESEV